MKFGFRCNASLHASIAALSIPFFIYSAAKRAYTSGEFGYSVAYPSDWNLQENNDGGSRDVILLAPGSKAFARIAGFKDDSLNSAAAVEASIAAYKASFATKTTEELKEFKSEMQAEIGGFMASGRMQMGEGIYQFLEKGLLATNGRVLIMRGGVDTSETNLTQAEFETHVATVKQIMESFATQ